MSEIFSSWVKLIEIGLYFLEYIYNSMYNCNVQSEQKLCFIFKISYSLETSNVKTTYNPNPERMH
jgi:hypothetical protein